MVSVKVIRYTHNPLESTVHISHIAQHAVAGERHAFSVWSLQLEVSSCKLPVISSAAERSREILSRRSIVKREKFHTDYTDFHRIFSPTTDYARKRADCTESDEYFGIPRLRLGMTRSKLGLTGAARCSYEFECANKPRHGVNSSKGLSFRTEQSGVRKPVVVPSFRAEWSGVEKSSLK